MRPLILTSLVFLCLLATAPAQMGMTNLPTRPLSLEEAIRLALENNLDIARVRYEPQIAQFALSDVSAYYEPTLNFDARHSSESRAGTFDPTIGLIPGSSTETDAAALGVGGILPLTGLRYGLSGTYSHNFGTAAGAPIDIYRSTAGITLRQPLLRDLWIDANRLNVKLARKDIKISEYAVMTVI